MDWQADEDWYAPARNGKMILVGMTAAVVFMVILFWPTKPRYARVCGKRMRDRCYTERGTGTPYVKRAAFWEIQLRDGDGDAWYGCTMWQYSALEKGKGYLFRTRFRQVIHVWDDQTGMLLGEPKIGRRKWARALLLYGALGIAGLLYLFVFLPWLYARV